MKKTKSTSLGIMILAAILVFSFSVAAAKSENANNAGRGNNASSSPSASPDASASPSASLSPSATPSASPAKNKGQINAQEHRSAVANFVQALVRVADREGDIGEQVRLIARQQNESEATTTKATNAIENRSKIKTFLLGSDYKNLGALRSEMVQTRNRILQLNRLTENAQNASSTEEIKNQIQTLEQEQVKIENFIKDQEGKFSLFGWVVKLFNK